MKTGKEIVCDALLRHGVTRVFGNPGTTELSFVAQIQRTEGLEFVLGLAEGAVIGMADAHARIARKVGVAVIHAMPGLGNASGMIYEAKISRTPLVVLVGQPNAVMHLREPILHGPVERLGEESCKATFSVRRIEELTTLVDRAFRLAQAPPYGPVLVALPEDVLDAESSDESVPSKKIFHSGEPPAEAVDEAMRLLTAGERPVLVAGEGVARADAMNELVALAEGLSAIVPSGEVPVWELAYRSRISFPNTHPLYAGSLPIRRAGVRTALAEASTVLMVGGPMMPELFFDAGPGMPDGAKVIQIDDTQWEVGKNYALDLGIVADVKRSLAALVRALPVGTPRTFPPRAFLGDLAPARVADPAAPIAHAFLTAFGEALPERCIVFHNVWSIVRELADTLRFDGPRDCFCSAGGGIGDSIPFAIGAAMADPDTPMIALCGDGSAVYHIQALWSAQRYQAPAVVVIWNNQGYRVLDKNARVKGGVAPEVDYALSPPFDMVAMAAGFGVSASRVDNPDALRSELRAAIAGRKPHLIDVTIPPAP